jgi:hypothetical protein
MRNYKEDTKDPFAEYDKFWDKLDEAEEIREDEDYFKERSIYKKQSFKKTDQEQMSKKARSVIQTYIAFTVFGFMIFFIFVGFINISRIFFFLPSFFVFGLVMYSIYRILSRLKNQ